MATDKTDRISELVTFAATSASIEEQANSALQDGKFPDGSTPVAVERRIWRAQVKSQYIEPETEIDPSENLDFLYKNAGKTVLKHSEVLSARDDITNFSQEKHQSTLDKLIQWRDCPQEHRPVITALIKEYWDVFDPQGALRPIRGYLFNIDVGNHAPVCCKPPRYGPHETQVMETLLRELERQNVIENDQGPYGAMIVLAAKPNQEHVHWTEYVFRLCVSYRLINAITRPFMFPIPRCDDEAEAMGRCEIAITADLDAGYWQVLVHKNSRDKTGFFTPTGKKHFCHLPMGLKNAAPFFVCMMSQLKEIWDSNFFHTELGLALVEEIRRRYQAVSPNAVDINSNTESSSAMLKADKAGSAIIIDDLLVYAKNPVVLLAYFTAVLQVLLHHRVSIKLRKTRFIPSSAEFVGMDLLPSGNAPASSKYGAIRKLSRPVTFGDLHMLIGMFGFYSKWIPYFEDKVHPWRKILMKKPPVDTSKEEEATKMDSLWTNDMERLLEEFKEAIVSGPILKRPDWSRPFYLKTDWSSLAKAAALCQPECTPEAEDAYKKEMEGGVCEFDKTLSGLRLRPTQMISKRCTVQESSLHSSVGELSTGRWSFLKHNKYLWYRPFTWITDCSGIIKFWTFDLMPTHQMQRWKLDMLRFDFTAVHRPEAMLCECNLLTRYNQHAEALRREEKDKVYKRDIDKEQKILDGLTEKKPTRYQSHLSDTTLGIPAALFRQHKEPPFNSFWNELFSDFEHYSASQNKQVGFTNVTVKVHGLSVNRSFLSEICDPGRLIVTVMPLGINLVETAMKEMRMDPLITAQAAIKSSWIEETNLCGISKISSKAEVPNSTIQADWIWTDLTGINRKDRESIETFTTLMSSRGVKAFIFSWNRQDVETIQSRNDWESWANDTLETWVTVESVVSNSFCGGPICKDTLLLFVLPKKIADVLGDLNELDIPEGMEDYLDLPNSKYSDYVSDAEPIETDDPVTADHPFMKRVARTIRSANVHKQVMDRNYPAPNPSTGLCHFLVETSDADLTTSVRPIRDNELLNMLGFHSKFIREALRYNQKQREDIVSYTIPKQTIMRVFSVLQLAEQTAQENELESLGKEDAVSYFSSPKLRDGNPFAFANAKVINRWTTFPMPSLQEWKEQSESDEDVAYLIKQITTKTVVAYPTLNNKGYFKPWSKGQFEVEDAILYQWEHPKAVTLRQLRRRVVPIGLRQLIYTAYHASPLAGHVGFYKTYWRIAARYFWPGMYTDVRNAVTECGHCILGNNVSHQAQQILGRLSVDEPFDIIAIDIWVPGVTDRKGSYASDKTNIRQAAITSLCNLTGFASVGFLQNMASDIVTQVIMSQIILPNGLPKRVLLDDDSLFKTDLIFLLDELGIPFHVVSAEQHEGVLCERFHRYLNKVQRIQGVDTKDHSIWMKNTALAAYAWNASPVDGTNIVRSFAARARTFHFPLDLQEEPERIIGNPGESTVQHVETMFPLWFRQKELLKLLILERREKHTEWANKHKKRRVFQPGDLVVIRRQVTSDAKTGRPAKLRARAKGPYRVLEKAGEDSYWVQRVPILAELNRVRGVKTKQAAWRLERIPSSVVVHKRIDSSDTRWIQQSASLHDSPLEDNLGFFDFGKYVKAPEDAKYAFDRAEDLLDIELDSDDEDEDDDDGVKEPQEEAPQGPAVLQVEVPKKIDASVPLSSGQQKAELVKKVKASKDKLFFTFLQRPGHKLHMWYVVQVDEDETNWRKAKSEGIYHVKYYVRCYADSKKKKIRECAYWPDLHQFKRDGVTIGPMVPTKPSKVEAMLTSKPYKFVWYQDTINLFETALAGPFDFEDGFRIPQSAWETLLKEAKKRNVYTGSVNRIVELGTSDRQDKDKSGVPSNHMAFRWKIEDGNE